MISILKKEDLKRRVLERLVYSVGKDVDHAVPRDWCVALTLAIRDRLVDTWMDTTRRIYGEARKRVYYLSMEFLIGRLLGDTISNLGLTEMCRQVMADLDVDFDQVLTEEPDAALGNGGLGRLAACFMDSMASLGIAGFGYGIHYEHGLFRQRIGDGWQIEEAEDWLTQGGNPWGFERPEAEYLVAFGGEVEQQNGVWLPAERVVACAQDMPIAGWRGEHVNTLRLWAANPAKTFDLSRFNRGEYLQAAEHEVLAETLTRVLYPDDSTDTGRELRLKQEYFFTSASAQDLLRRFMADHDDFERLPDCLAIQLNDTHPAIMVPELMRLLMDNHGVSKERALDLTRGCVSYTNHTLLPEALESWPLEMFGRVLPRHLEIIRQIDSLASSEINGVNKDGEDESTPHPATVVDDAVNGDENGGGAVRMGNLAFVGSHRVNGVSALHTRLMTETVFGNLHRHYPDRIVNVTNGVTPRRWLYHCNPALSELVTDAVGEDWVGDLEKIEALKPSADDPGFRERFAAVKLENKQALAERILDRTGIHVDPGALFDVQIKRIHEYKRQLMNALQVVARYQAILDEPDRDWLPVVNVFAGKAAPAYTMAKLIIKLINDIAETVNAHPDIADRLKVVYMPNYNVSQAEIIIPAADLSEQISTAGMEASGTGNMKLALNGALTIGTLDGANVEIRERVGEAHMFIFGLTAEEVAERRKDYAPAEVIKSSPVLSRAVKAISNGEFSKGDKDRFKPIVESLKRSDYFLVAADFDAYLESHHQVEQAYRDRDRWLRSAVLNTAGVGWFSSDRSIRDYDRQIWHTLDN
ncbi:MAG: glycogen/starch/alpha-glucan phosphorylase [Xanthomonadales bacterium]|nr:glycogen/starch/alpha-glucan phosphorylase [Xanthomonadales bacterium]